MVSDVSPSHPLGGGERMLWEQARRLAARGHDVRVVSRADPDATAPVSVERERVRIHHFLADRRSTTRFIKSSIYGARRVVSEVLAGEPADVLHVHQPLAGYGALTSRAGALLPSLYSFYSPAPLEYRSRRGMTARHRAGFVGATGTAMLWAIERACLRRAGLVHVLSDFSADQLWKLYAVPRERIGLFTVEALASGTTVLGTPVGATPEILRALCPTLVFRGTTPEMMAEDLERFLGDKERDPAGYARLREASREHVERHYTWERATDELERTLHRVADAGRNGKPASRATTHEVGAETCPGCGGPTRPSALVYRGVRYRRCPTCRSSLSMELPTAVELRHTYETEYPLLFAPEQVTSGRTRLFGSLLDRLAALGHAWDERPRLIDVGCGGGHLAALARGRRWLALSTDIAHQACAVAGRGGETPAIQADGALLPFRGATVDMVTLVNVVDQAHEPLTILREAHRVLVAGGLLALRVPNARFHRPWARLLSALGPLVRSRGWDTYPVVHHFAFTPSGLRRLVERAGFRVLEVSNSAPASREPVAKHAALGTLPRWGRATIAAGAAALAELSPDRWLVGPSLEPYPRKGPR